MWWHSWDSLKTWAYGGVDVDLAGNGGDECLNFIPNSQKILETILFGLLALFEIYFGYHYAKLPTKVPVPFNGKSTDTTGKKFLLLIHALVFGLELGFKFSTRQLIFLLNPCHVITVVQCYLLIAPPTRTTMIVFRVHIHCINGATMALLFPVTNTRLLPIEPETYFIQHGLMLLVPCYLLSLGGEYTVEPLMDYHWDLFACGVLFMYHWAVLQPIAIVTKMNLNNMLCPAISDPFYGVNYRSWAVLHQTAGVMLHGKVFTAICLAFLPKPGPENVVEEKPFEQAELMPEIFQKITKREAKHSKSEESSNNGHSKVL